MATISAGGAYGHHTFYLNTSESNVDTLNNRSTVNWNFQITGSGWDFYDIGSTIVITINGQQVYNSYAQRSYNGSGTATWASGSIVVPHNNDGSKTVDISFSYSQSSSAYYTPGNASASGSMTLTKINRYAVTNSVIGSDIEGNFSVNYTKYLDTYQYKLRISVPNVVLLERIDNYISGSTITLSQETIEALYQRFTTTNTFNLGFAVETWNSAGTSKLSDGNEKIISCKITGATPIFNDFDYNDINPTTLSLTGNSKYNINGYSTIRVSISAANKAIAQKGATMSKYQLIIGNTSMETPYSDSEDVYIDIPNSSIGEYKVYAIDSRNNSTLVTKLALQNINYEPLYVSYDNSSVERTDDGLGENIILTYNGTMWNNSFGNENNAITSATYKYQEIGTSNWITPSSPTTIIPTLSQDGKITFTGQIRSDEADYEFDLNKSYLIKIIIEDELSSYELTLNPVPSGIPNISLNKNGVGIMCDYDESIGGDLQISGQRFDSHKVLKYEIETATNSYEISGLNITSDNLLKMTIIPAYSNSSPERLYLKINDTSNYNFTSTRIYAIGTATSQQGITTSSDYIITSNSPVNILDMDTFSYTETQLFIENGDVCANIHQSYMKSGLQRNLYQMVETNKSVSSITKLILQTNTNQIPVGTKIFIEII